MLSFASSGRRLFGSRHHHPATSFSWLFECRRATAAAGAPSSAAAAAASALSTPSSQCHRGDRYFHASPPFSFLSSSNSSAGSQLPRERRRPFSLTTACSGGIDTSPAHGFNRYFHEQSKNSSPSSSQLSKFGTFTNDKYSNDDDNEEDLGNANENENSPYLHPQGQQQTDHRSELQNWHTLKENQASTLFSRVTSTLQAPIQSTKDIQSILSLMTELQSFVTSITIEMMELSPFRQKNPMYPPSVFMREYTYRAAEQVENLLSYLLLTDKHHQPKVQPQPQSASILLNLLSPEVEVTAYRLTLSTWSHVYHPTSGDRAEYILEKYGEKYGGDLNYMPGLEEYNVILKSYGMACSTFLNDVSGNEEEGGGGGYGYDHDNLTDDGIDAAGGSVAATTTTGGDGTAVVSGVGKSPGEKAIDLLTLLDSVHTGGDMFLRPNTEMLSNVIYVIRHTCLDWMNRRRLKERNEFRLEENLVVNLLKTLERMENLIEEEEKAVTKGTNVKSGGDGIASVTLSPKQYHGMIRAYADGIAIAANVPLESNNRDKDDGITAQRLLNNLEAFISRHSHNIVRSCVDDTKLTADIQRHVEESYTNALSAGVTLSKEGGGGAFANFDAALQNAIASDELFQRMKFRSKDMADASFLYASPTVDHYRALLTCWCECVRKRYSNDTSNRAMAALPELPHVRAVNLLRQLEKLSEGQCIDGSIYVDIIWAWGQLLNWPAVYRGNDYFFAINAVDEVRRKTMSLYETNSIYFPWNGSVTKMYNITFRLHSNIFKGGERAMKRSLNLLDEMEYWYNRSGGMIARPDEFTFGLIMKTISNSGVPTSASIAEEMVRKMEKFGRKPREKHYLALIRAYSRVGQNDVSDPRQAESILQQVKEQYKKNKSLKPTTAMYSAVISAYGGSREYNSISKVVELFEELKQLYKDTNDEAFKPDSMLYGGVIDAITKAKSNASLHRALQMLDMMEQSHDAGDIESGPNRYAFTNLLRAISQSRIKDGGSMAEDLLNRMDRRAKLWNDTSLRPDTSAYTSLIQVFANDTADGSDAVQRAQKWFHQMEKRYEDGDTGCKPNRVTCTALLNCWRKSERPDAGEEAEKIITMMETRYKDGDLAFKPDAYAYAATIDAWARGKSLDKATRAWKVYQRMKEQYTKGNMESQPNNIIVSTPS